MLINYVPVLIFMLVAIGLVAVIVLLVRIAGQEEALPHQGHAV